MRPSGGAERFHGEGSQTRGLFAPGARDHCHLSGRRDHASLQQGDIRGIRRCPALDLTAFLVVESLNALSQAALLFFLGVGLTLIFGIMRIVNFAHGTFYMLGAFIGYSVVRFSGSFWLALVGAPLAVGIVGALFELGILRRLYRRDESAFLMVTFGLALVLTEMIRF